MTPTHPWASRCDAHEAKRVFNAVRVWWESSRQAPNRRQVSLLVGATQRPAAQTQDLFGYITSQTCSELTGSPRNVFDATTTVPHRDTHPHPRPHADPRHDPQLRCYTHSHLQPRPGPHHRSHHRPRRCSYGLRQNIYHAVDGSCASHHPPSEIITCRLRSNCAEVVATAGPACHPLLRSWADAIADSQSVVTS